MSNEAMNCNFKSRYSIPVVVAVRSISNSFVKNRNRQQPILLPNFEHLIRMKLTEIDNDNDNTSKIHNQKRNSQNINACNA